VKDLTALLERLPVIRADDFSDLPKHKRWWLSQTDEYFERRNKKRRAQRKKNKWPSDNKEASRARSRKQYLRKVGRDRDLTHEERSELAKKREAALTPAQRSARTKKGWEKRKHQ
jgi:hypothetical protein